MRHPHYHSLVEGEHNVYESKMSMKVKCHAVELSTQELSNLSTFGKKEDHLDLYQDPVWSF